MVINCFMDGGFSKLNPFVCMLSTSVVVTVIHVLSS